MTTHEAVLTTYSLTRITLTPRPSQGIDPSLWSQGEIPLFERQSFSPLEGESKSFLVPTQDWIPAGEEYDEENAPVPTPTSELPPAEDWVRRFVIGVVEIWAGKRSPMQLSRWSHHRVNQQLIQKSALISDNAKIRKIYLHEPIEGVIEATATLRIKDRVRSLMLRFEGVDQKWMCTELILL